MNVIHLKRFPVLLFAVVPFRVVWIGVAWMAGAQELTPPEPKPYFDEPAWVHEIGVGGGPSPVQYLPARYNEATELTAEVTADGENTFQFDLKSDK